MGKEHRKETESRRISLENPDSCWIGRSCADVKHRSWRAEEKEDRDPQPQDLIQISRKNEGRQIRQKLRGRYTIEKSQGEIPT
jgi:hypothetical protein